MSNTATKINQVIVDRDLGYIKRTMRSLLISNIRLKLLSMTAIYEVSEQSGH